MGVKLSGEYESTVMGLHPELIRSLRLIKYWMHVETWDPPLGERWNFSKRVTRQIKLKTIIREVSPAFPSGASSY